MDDASAQVPEMDAEKYYFFHAEWISSCCEKVRLLSASEAIVLLCGKKFRVDDNDTSFFIEKACENAHECTVKAKTEAELARRFGTYCSNRPVFIRWKLFAVAYR